MTPGQPAQTSLLEASQSPYRPADDASVPPLRLTLAEACAELRDGLITRYVPPPTVCGCGRCGR
jgi:hypothetical protein